MLEWFWYLRDTGLLKAVLPSLGWGILWIGGIAFAKWCDVFSGPFWSKLQLAILVYTVLSMCWDGYWVLHPSKQEVQWQRGTDDYGLN
ncbi:MULTISPECIES: hypothetical protein [Aeromonas]|uniref:hypothetical protein n=1 Tax=Aeromonas TaxID=642 RepID=UPI0029D6E596|nr:hypothetical protein [Aeromonas caviae]MDX7800292.1 hypothetical protein [Aeromonas caviae]